MDALATKLLPPRWVLPTAVKPHGAPIKKRVVVRPHRVGQLSFLCQFLLHGGSSSRIKASFVCKIPSTVF